MMNFEAQFNINENAWYMKGNKPVEVIISAIEISQIGTNKTLIKYNAKNVTGSVSWLDHQNVFEIALFKSKGALLKSLFGGDTVCKGKNCSAINEAGHSDECIKEHDDCVNGIVQH